MMASYFLRVFRVLKILQKIYGHLNIKYTSIKKIEIKLKLFDIFILVVFCISCFLLFAHLFLASESIRNFNSIVFLLGTQILGFISSSAMIIFPIYLILCRKAISQIITEIITIDHEVRMSLFRCIFHFKLSIVLAKITRCKNRR